MYKITGGFGEGFPIEQFHNEEPDLFRPSFSILRDLWLYYDKKEYILFVWISL